jgi:glycerol uptake facilitator-like aquaporin
MLGPISGAHMNPAVSLVAASRRELAWTDALAYIAAQSAFGILGAWAAHRMFDLPTLQLSVKARGGLGKGLGEFIATFGLILTILGTLRYRREWVAPAVALYIVAAYWFTSSTSFAHPAITVARSFTNTFAGIAPHDVPLFVVAQLLGAACAALIAKWLFDFRANESNQPLAQKTLSHSPRFAISALPPFSPGGISEHIPTNRPVRARRSPADRIPACEAPAAL